MPRDDLEYAEFPGGKLRWEEFFSSRPAKYNALMQFIFVALTKEDCHLTSAFVIQHFLICRLAERECRTAFYFL